MKNLLRSGLAALAAAALAGCVVRSIEPWMDDATVVSPEGLTGSWTDAKNDVVLVFGPPEDDKAFPVMLINRDSMETAHFRCSRHRLDGLDLLQFTASKEDEDKIAVFPIHFVLKAVLSGDSLKLYNMNAKAVRGKLGVGSPKHVPLDETEVLFHDKTDAQQAFLKKHLKDADLFEADPVYSLARPPAPKDTEK